MEIPGMDVSSRNERMAARMRRKSASYPSWMPRDRYGGIRAEHLAVMEASVAESDVDYLLVDGWQYELAALLSQIESVTLPPELLEKIYTGNDLAEPEGGIDRPAAGRGSETGEEHPSS